MFFDNIMKKSTKKSTIQVVSIPSYAEKAEVFKTTGLMRAAYQHGCQGLYCKNWLAHKNFNIKVDLDWSSLGTCHIILRSSTRGS